MNRVLAVVAALATALCASSLAGADELCAKLDAPLLFVKRFLLSL